MPDNTKKCKKCGKTFEGEEDTCAMCKIFPFDSGMRMSKEEMKQIEKKGERIRDGLMHGIPPWDAGRV